MRPWHWPGSGTAPCCADRRPAAVVTALAEVAPWLRCPVCHEAVAVEGGVTCVRGHRFDIAKQGYVNLLPGDAKRARNADTAEMLAARARFLAAGHYAPLTALLRRLGRTEGLVLDAGSGPGSYLAAVLEGAPQACGLALDRSVPAARRAARAHPRAAAAVADLRGRLPLAADAISVLLNVFSPRNADEYRRVLRPDGVLLTVTPGEGHLAELIGGLALISVDAAKQERLRRSLGDAFTEVARHPLRVRLELRHEEIADAVLMGPNAYHVEPARLRERIGTLPEPFAVTASFVVTVSQPV